MVRAIAAEGTTVLLTTQYLEEADRLADRLAVIDQGKLIAEGSNQELKASVGGRMLHLRLGAAERLAEAQALLQRVLGEEVHNGDEPFTLASRVSRDDLIPRALATLADAGVTVIEFSLAQPSLDDVFFALTGHAAETDTERETAHE